VARAWFGWFVFASIGEDSNAQNFREVELVVIVDNPSAQFGLWSFRINFRNSCDSMRENRLRARSTRRSTLHARRKYKITGGLTNGMDGFSLAGVLGLRAEHLEASKTLARQNLSSSICTRNPRRLLEESLRLAAWMRQHVQDTGTDSKTFHEARSFVLESTRISRAYLLLTAYCSTVD
jgi:hypothetical protein